MTWKPNVPLLPGQRIGSATLNTYLRDNSRYLAARGVKHFAGEMTIPVDVNAYGNTIATFDTIIAQNGISHSAGLLSVGQGSYLVSFGLTAYNINGNNVVASLLEFNNPGSYLTGNTLGGTLILATTTNAHFNSSGTLRAYMYNGAVANTLLYASIILIQTSII